MLMYPYGQEPIFPKWTSKYGDVNGPMRARLCICSKTSHRERVTLRHVAAFEGRNLDKDTGKPTGPRGQNTSTFTSRPRSMCCCRMSQYSMMSWVQSATHQHEARLLNLKLLPRNIRLLHTGLHQSCFGQRQVPALCPHPCSAADFAWILVSSRHGVEGKN